MTKENLRTMKAECFKHAVSFEYVSEKGRYYYTFSVHRNTLTVRGYAAARIWLDGFLSGKGLPVPRRAVVGVYN